MANPRRRKQRVREALTKLAQEAANTETASDDSVVLAAADAAVRTGMLTQQEYDEVVSPLVEKQRVSEQPVKPKTKKAPTKKTTKKATKKTTKKSPAKKKTRTSKNK